MISPGQAICGLIAAEFPGWEVSRLPVWPMWGAWRQSPDGRQRQLLVAPSPAELLGKLRAVRGEVRDGGV